MYKSWLFSLIAIFFGQVCLANPKSLTDIHLTVGFVDFPPLTFLDTNQQPDGLLIQRLSLALEKVNISFKGVIQPNRRIVQKLHEGEIDLVMMTKSVITDPEAFVFSQQPIHLIELRAYWLGEKPRISNLEDLFGHKVILISAFTYGGVRKFIDENPRLIKVGAIVESHQRGFDALIKSRGDYLLDYKQPAELLLKTQPIAGLNHSAIQRYEIFYILNRRIKNAEQVMQKIERAHYDLFSLTKSEMENKEEN